MSPRDDSALLFFIWSLEGGCKSLVGEVRFQNEILLESEWAALWLHAYRRKTFLGPRPWDALEEAVNCRPARRF